MICPKQIAKLAADDLLVTKTTLKGTDRSPTSKEYDEKLLSLIPKPTALLISLCIPDDCSRMLRVSKARRYSSKSPMPRSMLQDPTKLARCCVTG